MDDIFKIQLRIADKQYPVKCKRSEERIYRSAANLINEKLLQYGNKYRSAPVDKKDLIIMVACDIAVSLMRLADQQNETPAYDKIKELTVELEEFIKAEI
jgi:cell division protein ZapA